MKVFGLTGGIGMGKSTAERLLRERGVRVIDTDVLARQVVEPGQPALEEIKLAFGNDVVASDGSLRRDALAGMVFSNAEARQKLERITHPRILKLWRAQIENWRAEKCPLAVVVIPLLFETAAETELDSTICVACSKATQDQRLLERGWTSEQIRQRNAAQWPVEKKFASADFVVWSEGGLDVLAQQLDRILPGPLSRRTVQMRQTVCQNKFPDKSADLPIGPSRYSQLQRAEPEFGVAVARHQ